MHGEGAILESLEEQTVVLSALTVAALTNETTHTGPSLAKRSQYTRLGQRLVRWNEDVQDDNEIVVEEEVALDSEELQILYSVRLTALEGIAHAYLLRLKGVPYETPAGIDVGKIMQDQKFGESVLALSQMLNTFDAP
jgi:hypothetical protein